jgi:hypothetical protein
MLWSVGGRGREKADVTQVKVRYSQTTTKNSLRKGERDRMNFQDKILWGTRGRGIRLKENVE